MILLDFKFYDDVISLINYLLLLKENVQNTMNERNRIEQLFYCHRCNDIAQVCPFLHNFYSWFTALFFYKPGFNRVWMKSFQKSCVLKHRVFIEILRGTEIRKLKWRKRFRCNFCMKMGFGVEGNFQCNFCHSTDVAIL